MRPISSLLAGCLGVSILATAAAAVTPQDWRTGGVEGWMATDRDSVGITSSGGVRLSLARTAIENVNTPTVWALLPDGDGILAAGGGGGELYRVTAKGAATLAATVLQPEITALGRDGRGRVLLGTAPDGVIHALAGDGAAFVADTPSSYIWSILPDPSGGAWLAGGNPGRIYRLDRGGEVSLLADLEVMHVTGLVASGDALLATTDGPGRLIRVGRDGGWEVLFEGEERELRSPVAGPDGTILFLANSEGANGATGRVYRRNAAGGVELLWMSAGGAAYQLSRGLDDVLWVSTGDIEGTGALVRLEPGPPSTWMEMLTVPEPQVLCFLLAEGSPRWVGTGGAGSIYRIDGSGAPSGRVTSSVHDAGASARWGALRVEPGPEARGVTASVRSGNTRRPDASWSEWKRVPLEGNQGPTGSAPARFLQWRLDLESGSGEIGAVRVVYLPVNRAPRISEVSISGLGAALDRIPDRSQLQGLAQQLPGGLRIEFQPGSGQNFSETASDEEAAWARRFRVVTWKASDPNGDPLRFEIDLRAAGESNWSALARDLENSPWIWDSSTVPDGWYEVRLLADDAAENPPGGGMTAGENTLPFLVDNTPPVLRDLAVSGNAVKGIATDASTAIRLLEFSVDGDSWRRLFPEDGIPDSPTERFSQGLPEGLTPGSHVVVVRAVDEAGNIGVGRARFEVR